MLQRMSSQQFAGWMAYAEIDPFGEWRADLRMGTLASLIANVNRDRKKKSKPFVASDFMPDFTQAQRKARKPLTSKSDWTAAKKMAKVYAHGKE